VILLESQILKYGTQNGNGRSPILVEARMRSTLTFEIEVANRCGESVSVLPDPDRLGFNS
jgi:hypothetical protein